jgi:hypothetical protein
VNEQERKVWNEAIDSVLELLRIHPPHRIGEAAFMRRLVNLKEKPNATRAIKESKFLRPN